MVDTIVKDHATWKSLIKKNTFRKWYQRSAPGDDRANVVDMFCASWNNINHELVTSKADPMACYNHLKMASRLAESISSMGLDHLSGWKLHKDWFKCMVAQLSIDAAIERDKKEWGSRKNRNSTMVILNDLFESFEWDLARCLRPESDDITRVARIDYLFEDKDESISETRHYNIIVEPTIAIPVNSVYESKGSGKHWCVLNACDNGDIRLCNVAKGDEEVSERVLRITALQVFSMKRIK